jgi:hypothetical protein
VVIVSQAFGDGWSGGTTLYVGTHTFTLVDSWFGGDYEEETVCLEPGTCWPYACGGDYQSEISWSVGGITGDHNNNFCSGSESFTVDPPAPSPPTLSPTPKPTHLPFSTSRLPCTGVPSGKWIDEDCVPYDAAQITFDLLPTMGGFFHLDALEKDCFNYKGFYSDECNASRHELKQTCCWYWCQSEHGCIHSKSGQSCEAGGGAGYMVLGIACMFTFCLFCRAAYNPDSESFDIAMLAFGLAICMPSAILAFISFNEFAFQSKVIVDIEEIPPPFLPTPVPSPRPTSIPTNTPPPTVTGTVVPAALNRGITFDENHMKTTGLLVLSILCLNVPFSIYFIIGLGVDCKSTIIIVYTVLLSQLDICMDITYIFFAEWSSTFLRLLSLLAMFLPFISMMLTWRALIFEFYCNMLWSTARLFCQLNEMVCGVYERNCTSWPEDQVCPFKELHEFIAWTIATALLIVYLILSAATFLVVITIGSTFFAIVAFIISGSKGLTVVVASKFNLNEKDSAYLFYGNVLAELLLESLPQLLLCLLNEHSSEVSALFVAQIVSSSLIVLNELWRLLATIINAGGCSGLSNLNPEFWKGFNSRIVDENLAAEQSL